MTLQELLFERLTNHRGFFSSADLAELSKLDRLRLVLVRCGACRFTCAAQDALHLMGIIAADGRDYVRDVSLPAADPARQGDYRPWTDNLPLPSPAPITVTIPCAAAHRYPAAPDGDYGGAFGGFTVTSDADPGL